MTGLTYNEARGRCVVGARLTHTLAPCSPIADALALMLCGWDALDHALAPCCPPLPTSVQAAGGVALRALRCAAGTLLLQHLPPV